MKFEYWSYSDIGGRTVNEDSLFVRQKDGCLLAIVADGVGGQGDGDAASQCAVTVMDSDLVANMPSEELLYEAICNANRSVRALQLQGKKMMTTLAAVWAADEMAIAATVGDTRIYQFREGKIVFQSVDHSVAQMAVLSGEITPEEIRTYPKRSRILRALGAEDRVKTDIIPLQLCGGDRLLLCSDGFWEFLPEREMEALSLETETAELWLERMCAVVKSRCQRFCDNNTAIAICIK